MDEVRKIVVGCSYEKTKYVLKVPKIASEGRGGSDHTYFIFLLYYYVTLLQFTIILTLLIMGLLRCVHKTT